jgi:hypothetical protein
VEHEDLTNAVIDCLPLEFESSKTSLYTQVIGMTKSQMIKHLRIQAYALKFDDLSPRPVPRAAPANPKPFQRTPIAAQDDRRTTVRCWECGDRGHTRRDCKKWADEKLQDVTVDQQLARQHLALHLHVRSSESSAVGSVAVNAVPCPLHKESGGSVDARVALNIFEHTGMVGSDLKSG